MVQIHKSHLIASYLILTAYMMGTASMWNQYACPNEGPYKTAIFTLFAGLIWPVGIAMQTLGGNLVSPPNCDNGIPAKRPR